MQRHAGQICRKGVRNLSPVKEHPVTGTVSEFQEYDRSSVICALYEAILSIAAVSSDDYLATLIKRFNAAHTGPWAKTFIGDACDRIVTGAIHGIDILDSSDGDRIPVGRYIAELTKAYSDIQSDYHKDKNCPLYPKTAKDYLDAFFGLSQKCVFNNKNFNLYDYAFRSSTFLKTLMTFASSKENNALVFDPWEPFALDALSRALVCAAELGRRAYEKRWKTDVIFAFRAYLLNCSIESSFERYMTLDGLTYRVELNRHKSKLIAQKMRDLSSTCETKPIRLFEKTAAYIRNTMQNGADTYEVRVCIIGHTEATYKGEESPLEDYILALLYWYYDLERKEKKILPKLDLRVRNIVNIADARNGKTLRRDVCLPEKFEGNCKASYEIVVENYEERFTFNTGYIEEEIRNNQLIFLLDCPWLSVENYEIGESSSLSTYCELLNRRKREEPDCLLNFDTDFAAFYKYSTMRQLGAQYNRIMGSKSLQAGYVVRSMKDALIRRIQDIVRKMPLKQGKKELYIFSSENEGIDFSYVSTYPLTRLERYDGKSFDIIQFKNYPSQMLECLKDQESISFDITLWSILKYTCVSFAYCEFKVRLLKCLGIEKAKIPILIWAIYHGTIIRFNLGKDDLTNVEITLCFDESITDILEKIGNGIDPSKAMEGLKELIMEFIQPLYRNSVFSDDPEYGDDAIKTAFEMNLQSGAHNVDTMYFLHKYRVARRTGTLSQFRLKFAENTEITEGRDFLGRDFFMNRKLYNSFFSTLERSTEYSMGLFRMLKYSEESACFEKRDNASIEAHIARNIVKVCRRYGDGKSFLAMNASQKCLEP